MLQSVVVKKSHPDAHDCESAADAAASFGVLATECEETGSSYRFRRLDPEFFHPKSFRTKRIGQHISLVYGKLAFKLDRTKERDADALIARALEVCEAATR